MVMSGPLNTLTALPFAKVPLPSVFTEYESGWAKITVSNFDQDKDLWTLPGIEEIKVIVEF
jgi:hypothetical protein